MGCMLIIPAVDRWWRVYPQGLLARQPKEQHPRLISDCHRHVHIVHTHMHRERERHTERDRGRETERERERQRHTERGISTFKRVAWGNSLTIRIMYLKGIVELCSLPRFSLAFLMKWPVLFCHTVPWIYKTLPSRDIKALCHQIMGYYPSSWVMGKPFFTFYLLLFFTFYVLVCLHICPPACGDQNSAEGVSSESVFRDRVFSCSQ